MEKKKKMGSFKSIQKIIDQNKEINDTLSQSSPDRQPGSPFDSALKSKKIGSLSMSSVHLQRLNKIHQRF
jgi:hypothetical protein